MTKVVLAIADFDDGSLSDASLEVLAAARKLAGDDGAVAAVCFGADIDDAHTSAMASYGADRIVLIESDLFASFQADAWLNELAPLVTELEPHSVLFPHSLAGMEVAPRLAFRVDGSIITACSAIDVVEDQIHWTRSCYGGALRQTLVLRALPMVATIAVMAFEPVQRDAPADVDVQRRPASSSADAVRARVVERQAPKTKDVDLRTANIIVAGGRGVGGPEGFKQLGHLGKELDAAVGASRVACDLGWCSHALQVGLSGKTVAPKLYIAFGISGAPQHLAGCANARTIVAVNTDDTADIFKSAQFGVVADCAEFIPALTEEIQKRREVV